MAQTMTKSESESLSSSEEEDEKKDPNYVDWKNMENIRVICRFRPINSREMREEKSAGLIDYPPIITNQGSTVRVVREGSRASAGPMEFNLDKILGTTTSQQALYLNVGKPMVEACLEGYNTTIFAYGQTGSGKTYTMFGPEKLKSNNELGCVQRSLSFLFSELNGRQEKKALTGWKVMLHFVQLYREKLMDLLEPLKGIALKIRYDPQTDAPYVPNLRQVDVTELGEVIKLLAVANRNRVTDKTLMNAESSRSHMIMTLSIEQTLKDGTVKKSKLNFADLAGSETYEKALGGTRGGIDRKKVEELKTINLSLTNLTTCINYLSKGRKASYRSSQLTFYLMDSLGGNSKTTLVVAASPHIFNRSETIRTMRFAKTAKSVKNKAKVNKELSKKQLETLVKKLQRENKKLKARLTLFEAELIKNGIEVPMLSEVRKKKKHKRAKSMMNPKTVLSQDTKQNLFGTAALSTSTTELLEEMNIIEENGSNNKSPKKRSKNKSNTLQVVTENVANIKGTNRKMVFGKVDESAYNKLKAQLKSFQEELSQQEEDSTLLREQLSKKNVELDGLSEQLQASNSISQQFDALQDSKRQLAMQLQSKSSALTDIQNAFESEREELKSEKAMLEEELNESKSDMQQYEQIMDNMKLSNGQLTTEVGSLRDTIASLQQKVNEKKAQKDIKESVEQDKLNKANDILSKYFTVANTKGIEMSDKQLNETETKIETLSKCITDITQAYEKFTGQNFSLEPQEYEQDSKQSSPSAKEILPKQTEKERERPKKKKKTHTSSSSLQNRMAMFGGGAVKKKRRKSKAKNKMKEYTESIVKTDPQKNLVFQTERLTHYLSSAMTTIDKQKKAHSEELESKITKKNTTITNLSIENKGLKNKLDRELTLKQNAIDELMKEIEDLKIAAQNATITKSMDEAEELFDVKDQIAYLSNITQGLEDMDTKLPLQVQQSHNPTQIALWRQQLQVGSKLDCLDEACLWWTSVVTDSDGYRIKVRYDGFDVRWDEWVDRGSTRIAPYMTKAKGGRESKGVSVNLKVVAKKKDKRTGKTKRVYKQGWLVKQGKRFKSYKTRYFTLMDDGTMEYSKKMTDQTPAGTFNVKNMIETRRIAYPTNKDLYGFEIVTKKRTWRFQAHSDDVVADWIGVIHAVSKGVEPDNDEGGQAVIYSGYGIKNISLNLNGNSNGSTHEIKGRHRRQLSIQEESSSHPPINRLAFAQLLDSPTTTPMTGNIGALNEDGSGNENEDLDIHHLNVQTNNKSRAEEPLLDSISTPPNNINEDGGNVTPNSEELDVQHSGWMHKAGKWDANWTYRYCVLTGEPVTLRCYVAPNKKQTKCIKFTDVISCIELKKNSGKFGQLEIPTAFAFQLCTSSRIYTFACKSRHEVNVWLKKIRKVVDVSSSDKAKFAKRSSLISLGSTLNKLGTSFGRLIGVTQEHVTTTEVLKTEDVQIQKNEFAMKTDYSSNLGQINEWSNINVNTMGINGISADRRASLPILHHNQWSNEENNEMNSIKINGMNGRSPTKKTKGRRKSAPDLRALKNPKFMTDLVNLENEFKENINKTKKSIEELIGTRHRGTVGNKDNIKSEKKQINQNIASVLQTQTNNEADGSNDSEDDDLSDIST